MSGQYNNPFADNGASTNPYAGYEPPSVRTSSPVPSHNPSWAATPSSPSSSSTTSKDLDMKEESLRRREQELMRREQDLENRERILREQGGLKKHRPPNWPRWPKSIVHQDLNADIQDPELRSLVRKVFLAWHVLCFIMVWNLVAMTGVLAVANSIGDFILAIVYIFIWLPISFMHYRHLYNAARRGRAIQYFLFFFFYGFQILAHIFWGIGVKGAGMAGLLRMFDMFASKEKGSSIVGIFCLIGTALIWLMAAFGIYAWIHARVHYKRRGGNNQLEKELATSAGTAAANNPDAMMQAGSYAASRA